MNKKNKSKKCKSYLLAEVELEKNVITSYFWCQTCNKDYFIETEKQGENVVK